MNIRTAGFIGLGLIGGSIAKAIRQVYPDIKIIAHASHTSTLEEAYDAGVITNNTPLPLSEFANTDVLFLCSPVKVNLDYMSQLAPLLKDDCIITDVGSVKGDIHKHAHALSITNQFIGGHPMTGSEKIGFSNSDPSLLENAYYILTKDEHTDQKLYEEFSRFISSLGPLVMALSPEEHDFATAAISHLPHVISASLVNVVKNNDENSVLKTIAAGGFKDITRISSSSPVMWQNICMENKEEILKLIDLYKQELEHFTEAISKGNEAELIEQFSSAKNYRDSLRIRKSSLLPRTFECFVDIPDVTGVIAKVATLLAKYDISIQNIGIVNNREYANGALHIEFKTETDLLKAETCLKKNGFKTFPKQ
ncbi:MAG: prephenate dehydrogenase [Lachnospiraceae bacterium]|nr:prephenate dehydrogenase [Lachnospiraceae bacterium]